jgi:hypothetical protein
MTQIRHKLGHRMVALMLGAAAWIAIPAGLPTTSLFNGAALAQTHTGGSGGQGGGGHSGGSGGHDDTGDDGHSGGKGGPGGQQGGGGAGHGKGQGQGQGGKQGARGKPVWAQEGIPEVELGRLNVARSPDRVLQRAYDEALASLSPDMAAFYSMSVSQMVYELSTNFDNLSYIDSPLQNLALLKDALDGSSVLTSTGEIKNDTATLMANFLGIASDKNLPISADTVTAVTTILGKPMSPTQAATLAADAEAIRIAVLAGHG